MIVDLPEDQKAIGSGWVFKVKHNQDGSIERFKARLVAKGLAIPNVLDWTTMKALHLPSALLHFALSWLLLQLRTLNFALWTYWAMQANT